MSCLSLILSYRDKLSCVETVVESLADLGAVPSISTMKHTLPDWAVRQLNDEQYVSDNRDTIDSIAREISSRTNNVHSILTSGWKNHKDSPSKVILLGFGVLEAVEEISVSVEQCDDLDLVEYLSTMSELVESLERLVVNNYSNLKNEVVRKHLIDVTNRLLIETKVLAITNVVIDELTQGED